MLEFCSCCKTRKEKKRDIMNRGGGWVTTGCQLNVRWNNVVVALVNHWCEVMYLPT